MKYYTERSNARRAARKAGVDPDTVRATPKGYTFDAGEAAASAAPGPQVAACGIDHNAEGELPKALCRICNPHLGIRPEASGGVTAAPPERRDFRKPKGMSWEEWDAHQAARASAERAATDERVKALREKHGPEQEAARAAKKAAREAHKPKPDWQIKVRAAKCPYREGSAGAAVFALYKTGMTLAALEKAAAGLTGKRRPIDMLLHDVRKGHIEIAPPEAKKGSK